MYRAIDCKQKLVMPTVRWHLKCFNNLKNIMDSLIIQFFASSEIKPLSIPEFICKLYIYGIICLLQKVVIFFVSCVFEDEELAYCYVSCLR